MKTRMEIIWEMLGAGGPQMSWFLSPASLLSPFLPYLHTSVKRHLNKKPQMKKLLKLT